jgi:peptidoglycan/xylan/chitin deacetylase (PgdA/CDA1 family)
MFTTKLIVLSYHRFTEEDNDYVFSRTYKQFASDIIHKDFDWITIDDGHSSILKACEMMKEKNIRAKLFIATSLIGKPGYCTWEDVWRLSRFHDIGNHSHSHERLTELSEEDIFKNIWRASLLIKKHTFLMPRYFVPPYNNTNHIVEGIALQLGLTLIKDRIEIKNNSR